MSGFFEELQRRKVYWVAAAYIVGNSHAGNPGYANNTRSSSAYQTVLAQWRANEGKIRDA
ncbi:MAG: hypothetical protein WA849_03790 [Candidatus Udaeobacter sp.]